MTTSRIDELLELARARLRRVEPAELAGEMDRGALVVDIRPDHYRRDEGALPGAVVIERNVLEWRLDPTSSARLPQATEGRKVILFCNDSYASSLAAVALVDLGLADATDLAGGYRAWRQLPSADGMDATVVATGLAFPEGPVWLDGGVVVTEVEAGVLSHWSRGGELRRIADVGGGPNGATLGPDGALYVTQNGGMSREGRVTPGILRVELADGSSELIATEVGGLTLEGPNDLAFGPEGRLYFTDPRGAADPARNDRPGRLFAFDVTTAAPGPGGTNGELIVELGPVFPNGIAFDAEGTLLWTESFTRRVMRLHDGRPEVVIELPERHAPDGMCIGLDGTLYVASTYAHCVSVIRDGEIVDRLMCGDGMVTNCCFGGTDLYATDARRGALYRFPLGVEGLPLY